MHHLWNLREELWDNWSVLHSSRRQLFTEVYLVTNADKWVQIISLVPLYHCCTDPYLRGWCLYDEGISTLSAGPQPTTSQWRTWSTTAARRWTTGWAPWLTCSSPYAVAGCRTTSWWYGGGLSLSLFHHPSFCRHIFHLNKFYIPRMQTLNGLII